MKESLARQLGAHHDIDSIAQDAVTELQTLGGACVILATAPNAPAISALMDGLSPGGTLWVPAAPAEPLTIELVWTVWRMPAYRRAPRPRTALHAPSVDLFDSFAT